MFCFSSKAIKLKNEKLARLLLDRKIEYSIKNKNNFNVFHVIAKYNSINILKILIKYLDAEVVKFSEEEGQHKQTPLHIAAKYDSVEVAEYLINELKVDKEANDYKLRTPLFIAAEFSKLEEKFFLHKNIYYVFIKDRKDMVKLLLKLKCNSVYRDPLTKKTTLHDTNGQTSLFWIIKNVPECVSQANFHHFKISSIIR
jgi:ankyrin repeat protein